MSGRFAIQFRDVGKSFLRREMGEDCIEQAPWRDTILGSLLPAAKLKPFTALQRLSFDVRKGERIALLGRNGAGKSTLLKLIARVMRPSEGEIRINGRVGSLLEVGAGFHPDLTGRENLFLSGAILGMTESAIRRRIPEIVEFAEIGDFLETPVKRYSSGMYLRLAFAVASHVDAEIMLVDEALAVGDAAFQDKCIGRIRTLHETGSTLLFVSHSPQAVLELCERGLVLDRGRIVYDLPIHDAVDAYETMYSGAERA